MTAVTFIHDANQYFRHCNRDMALALNEWRLSMKKFALLAAAVVLPLTLSAPAPAHAQQSGHTHIWLA